MQFPLDSAFDADVVVNVGDTDQEAVDTVNFALATQAAVAGGGCATPKGLPDDGVIPAASGNPRAELAFGEGRNGFNAWKPDPAGNVIIDVPDAGYGSVHVFAISTNGSSELGVELFYETGPVAQSVTVPDWFTDPADPVYAAVADMDRMEADGDPCDNADEADLFGIRVEADETKRLEQIGLTFQSGPGNLTVLGAVGEAQRLIVTRAGTGSGSVAGAGIACGTDCDELFATAETVELTATPDAGSRFAGWEGACSGTGACSVTMDEDRAVTARFEPTQTLTVTKEGDGAGTVTSSPAGIDCGADCSEAFVPGTTVTLTPAAVLGSQFSGWSGACSGTTFECVVTMDAAKAVTARFGAVVADGFFPPGPDRTAPLVSFSAPLRVRHRRLRRGIPITFTCSEACTAAITVRRGRGLLGSASAEGLATRRETVRIAIARRHRRALRRGGRRLTVQVIATDAAGNRTEPLIRRIRLRRPDRSGSG